MDSIEVRALCTHEGWVLVTADQPPDILAGPVATEAALASLAAELDLVLLVPKAARTCRVKDLEMGTLFRIKDNWYRVASRSKTETTVDVVGEKRQTTLPNNESITEISVMSLK